jgi:hypothetical protein
MADVTTYRRCTVYYTWGGRIFRPGDTAASTDPAVTANPQWWATLADADFTAQSDKKGHSWG